MPILPSNLADCILSSLGKEYLTYQGWVVFVKHKERNTIDCFIFDDLETMEDYISRLRKEEKFIITKPMAVTYQAQIEL